MMKTAKELMWYYRYIFNNEKLQPSDALRLFDAFESQSEQIKQIALALQKEQMKQEARREIIFRSNRLAVAFLKPFQKQWRVCLVVAMVVAGLIYGIK